MKSSHAADLSVPRTGKSEVTTLDHAGAATLPLLLTVEEVAEQLHIGRTKAFAMVKSGEIESVMIGERGRRVPREAVIEYIARLREQG
ncbi:helix-turn-helix domain-containing protein [Nonomuraea sp. NPDC049158]|uniref:helix-turn-helix domain-containing protein n=1 Tax=Nonomuraea sp. NPDC049158 TaxID=3155649 RepID=UPI0034048875